MSAFEKACGAAVKPPDTAARLSARALSAEAEVERLRASLRILAEHEPSWSDDFLRARAALLVTGPVKQHGASIQSPSVTRDPGAPPMNLYLVSRWGNAKDGADGADTNFLVVAPTPEAAVALGDAALLDHPWHNGPNVCDFCHCAALLGTSWSPDPAVIHGPWVATNILRWRVEDGVWISDERWTRNERGPLDRLGGADEERTQVQP